MIETLPSVRSLTRRLLPSLPQGLWRSSAGPAGPTDAGPARQGPAAVPPLRPRVEIPVRESTPESRALAALRDHGRHLARQENWESLCHALIEAERNRHKTPGLVPVARALAEGAQTDVLQAARTAAARSEPQVAYAAIATLESNIEEMPDCPGLAAIVALAHAELAQLWRGHAALKDLSAQRREAHSLHLQAAARLADRFDPFAIDAPLWAGLRCAVLGADPAPHTRVADDYEDLIDLDPECPDHMRAFGRDLLPDRFGTWEALDLQARRTAASTRDVWGDGGYTWVLMGALERRTDAARRLDPDVFVSGLHDILDRHPDQHMVNRLAAFTGATMAAGQAQDGSHRRIAECFGWIAQNHLREVHPLVWAEAPVPWGRASATADAGALAALGKARALSTLGGFFAAHLGQNSRLVFGPDGLRVA